ncbi:hypothetical protein LEP1GSC005_2410 [Leptospira santarosai str. ST188]|uniref:Uncharacterized protein n=1 Tax=Leptospira santarosai str. MOR084 TaxID=1049984 RepID=A0A0E2BI71_9LEPT|nr:hypothetical protein LEP1GSC179_1635 [Leptospira santarosai str. MOR084]EMF89648.1 hypothetical protein LEP1GSC005_2410 [Leptospira santarosai str. ST188]EMO70129.1 hypothetical protein LEP1GSC130_3049 [Leptospira santarosai str. 200403458]EMO96898.1 hypothetical protein LEP1GSC120_3806 [Leptospira santarosai str. 200702252]
MDFTLLYFRTKRKRFEHILSIGFFKEFYNPLEKLSFKFPNS